MAEWLNAAVLKTARSETASWVRIPLPPLELRESGGSGRSVATATRGAIRKGCLIFLRNETKYRQPVLKL